MIFNAMAEVKKLRENNTALLEFVSSCVLYFPLFTVDDR